ncbi:MAG: DNA-directed RNA polymerase subunit alpha [Nitrospirota bacterium]|nr:DNA-directed RNA polymerase subunit alpha [Nitrospirota bacterium]
MLIRTPDFQSPKGLEVDRSTLTSTYGRFTAEPFERGFGTTIGNAIRRVLLSSIAGAAVTGIRIDGALHEFTNIPGVREDVTDIVLNIKQLRLKSHVTTEKTITIQKSGPGVVTGADIQHDADIKVLNPDLVIANLNADAELRMQLQVGTGRGYVGAPLNKQEGDPIGVIPVDAIFAPVQRVNVLVESARVGRITDYDRLTLEVWTDGSVSPEDAVAFAAKILKDELTIFINFDEAEQVRGPEPVGGGSELSKLLSRRVSDLELSVRAANCLKGAGISTLAELVQRSEGEMLKTKNFGKKSLDEILEVLHEMGLHLGMDLDGVDIPDPAVAEQQG